MARKGRELFMLRFGNVTVAGTETAVFVTKAEAEYLRNAVNGDIA